MLLIVLIFVPFKDYFLIIITIILVFLFFKLEEQYPKMEVWTFAAVIFSDFYMPVCYRTVCSMGL